MSQIALMETIQNAFARFAWFVEAEIDRDTLEYLFETLRDGITDKDEFIDFVAPLISQLFEDDEDEARERAEEAFQILYLTASNRAANDDAMSERDETVNKTVINVKMGGDDEIERSELEREIERRLREK